MSDITQNTQLLVEAAKMGNTVEVKRLIPLSNPKLDGSLALHWAAINGHIECVELLIPVSDDITQPTQKNTVHVAAAYEEVGQTFTLRANSLFLIEAARNGDSDEVARLIPISDLKATGNKSLQIAAQKGHVECVKLLIPVTNPKAKNNKALCEAANHGHSACVKFLIPVSDPKADNNMALFWATQRNDNEIVDLLCDFIDPQIALDELMKSHPNQPGRWEYLKNKVEAQNQKNVLISEIVSVNEITTQRKM